MDVITEKQNVKSPEAESITLDNHTASKDKDTVSSDFESDTMAFLKKIKLESYYGILVSQGAEKLGHIIYLDDQPLDLLIKSCKMSMVHGSVFKKAIKECRPNLSNNNESSKEKQKYEHASRCCHSCMPCYHHNCCSEVQNNGFSHKRRYSPPAFYPYPMNYPNNYSYQLDPMAQQPGRYQQQFYHDQIQNYQRLEDGYQVPAMTTIQRQESDRSIIQQKECRVVQHPNSNEFEVHSTVSSEVVGYYPVKVNSRMVRFPPSVRQLTYYDSIDSERKDIVRKGSQIFGRDDTKRKTSELTALEMLMNEIAYEVCMRDFTYIMSRQRLLALVREIVKDNQIQLPNHIPNHLASVNGSSEYSQTFQSRSRSFDSKIKNTAGGVFPDGLSSFLYDSNGTNESLENGSSSDYDIILHHKVHREWPAGTSKEKRKYLGRRSSNFEVSNGELFYVKDGKCRKWLPRDEDVYKCFIEKHIDKETSEHYSKEKTFENIIPYYYSKNLNEILTRIYHSCESCRSRNLPTFQNPYGTRSSSLLLSNVNDSSSTPSIGTDRKEVLPRNGVIGNNDPMKRMIIVKTLQAPVERSKQPRKSIPHRYHRLPDDDDAINQTPQVLSTTTNPLEEQQSIQDYVANECDTSEQLLTTKNEHELDLTLSPQNQLAEVPQTFPA